MAEFRFGVVSDVGFDLTPVPLVVPDFLAVGANGQESAQKFDLLKGCLQFFDEELFFVFQFFSVGNVLKKFYYPDYFAVVVFKWFSGDDQVVCFVVLLLGWFAAEFFSAGKNLLQGAVGCVAARPWAVIEAFQGFIFCGVGGAEKIPICIIGFDDIVVDVRDANRNDMVECCLENFFFVHFNMLRFLYLHGGAIAAGMVLLDQENM